MNDRWQKSGTRWNQRDRIQVARLFRHHVRTPSNPRGRIHRECCWFCLETARRGGYPLAEHLPLAPFHHIDYARPFVGVWCCDKHHRMIDHDSLRVPARAIHDYTSLIEAPGVGRRGGRRNNVIPFKRAGSDVPF